MILGVGIDVVDVDRFMAALERAPGLHQRLFTPPERDLPNASLAARFAAKQAIAKALGAPGGLRWQDATVHRVAGGALNVVLSGTVLQAAEARGIRTWHLSLSHDAGIASAVAIAEG